MRAAIYARFSSELQDQRSITDQVALARKYVDMRGLTFTQTYSDAAISGASTLNRPGLQSLLADALVGRFNVIVTESLDRLSRSQADIAMLYEKMTFLGVRIETLADGHINEMHVGLKGTMSAMFLKDLAQKTRRGQVGRVKAGRIPGGKSYGYDVVRGVEERGLRTINAYEADIVRRIFKEYADGKGSMAIVIDLNKEGVAGPRGGKWSASCMLGSPKRLNGLLNNELYKGTIVYNRQRFMKDPATGTRVARENPQSEWQRQEVPGLRIIDQPMWDAVQSRRQANAKTPHLYQKRRPKRLLSGLLKCACCGGGYSVVRDDVLRCSTQTNSRSCDNTRTVRTGEIEGRILIALQNHLLAPDVVAAAVEAYREERQKLDATRRKRQNELTRDLAAVKRKTDAVLEIVMAGGADAKVVGRKLVELETEQERLEAELSAAPEAAVAIHPTAPERYRQKVAEIHDALTKGEGAAHEAIQLLRGLIDHIKVIPTVRPTPIGLQVVGNLAALLVDAPSGKGGAELLVAGAGFEPTTFRL